MALFFAYELFYNKIKNNDKLRIMNGFTKANISGNIRNA